MGCASSAPSWASASSMETSLAKEAEEVESVKRNGKVSASAL